VKASRLSHILLAVLVTATLLLAACQPAATPEPTATPTQAPTNTPVPPTPTPEPPTATPEPAIGSPEHPIKVLFVPSVDANVIVSGGKIMADALNKATGLTFEVSVPTSYAATIEEMCASPKDTIGFIPGLGYVLANQLCGVDVAFRAVRFGSDVYWAQILVPRDSDIKELKDLDGKKWGYTDPGSTSGYLVPLAMFKDAGIKPGESVETGGHPQAVKAVYNGEVDFATTFYTPPLKPADLPKWKEGDAPDIPDELVPTCKVTEDKKNIDCSGWTVLPAATSARKPRM
jgi:phosphonate transport system substrate-binding protein